LCSGRPKKVGDRRLLVLPGQLQAYWLALRSVRLGPPTQTQHYRRGAFLVLWRSGLGEDAAAAVFRALARCTARWLRLRMPQASARAPSATASFDRVSCKRVPRYGSWLGGVRWANRPRCKHVVTTAASTLFARWRDAGPLWQCSRLECIARISLHAQSVL
jgi:hypothetical protein